MSVQTILSRIHRCAWVADVRRGRAFSAGFPGRAYARRANLPITGSAELSERFFRYLLEGHAPGEALAQARFDAFKAHGSAAWSVPVLLGRPPPLGGSIGARPGVVGLPARRDTYVERQALQGRGVEAVETHRWVTLVGLPGIGKTELGKELARQVHAQSPTDQLIYVEVHPGFSLAALRARIATAP